MTTHTKYIFDKAYSERSPVFGVQPTSCVSLLGNILQDRSRVVDLGCGDGRDTMYLLSRGHSVHAIDFSREGIKALLDRAHSAQLAGQLSTSVENVLRWRPSPSSYDAVIGVTILDHLLARDHAPVIRNIKECVITGGLVVLEMHSDRDPSISGTGMAVSEFADAIRSHAPANYLIEKFMIGWRILHYEDRMEDDFDHGPAHVHGFSTVIAQKR